MYIELFGQFGQRLLALDSGQSHLRLEGRAMVPAWSLRHALSCSRQPTPRSGRISTYPACSDFPSQLCRHAPAIAQVKRNRSFSQIEAHHFGGYRHPGTEFLRLDIGAASERLARNAGWETEIILDTSARSSLSTEGARVEDGHRETLRCGIDRGREASGSRADDRDVVGSILF